MRIKAGTDGGKDHETQDHGRGKDPKACKKVLDICRSRRDGSIPVRREVRATSRINADHWVHLLVGIITVPSNMNDTVDC